MGEFLTEEGMKELPDYYVSWSVKLLTKAINNMTKLRDQKRIMCEILDIELDWNNNYTEAKEQLKVLREELDLCKIEYTKPSLEELTYSMELKLPIQSIGGLLMTLILELRHSIN